MELLKMRFRNIAAGLIACTLMTGLTTQAIAQGQLATAINVNDRVITQFELSQRERFLAAINTAGNIAEIARTGLIDDRLKLQEMERFNRSLSQAEVQQELQQFAARGGLSLDEFVQMLASNGVELRSFIEYVSIGVMWRDFIRARYNREITVTEADVDRALARQGNAPTQLEVLLSEIIIPAPPERAARVREVAGQIAALRSYEEFENAARQVSALPTRENGGRLDWVPITNYPPQIQTLLLELSTGEVTEPIEIPNAVALFQKRGLREGRRATTTPASIEYATYLIAGGTSQAAQRRAADVAIAADTCDDLYGIARDEAPEMLTRETLAPADIPADVALELARLDPGEAATLLVNGGTQLAFVMLCARNQTDVGPQDRDAVRNQIRSQRLAALADALLADLQASADIRR
ncbi:peptidylprolyl isomerase [Yoonia sp.]|uniref:peptidylprolyl isomerase n=1 Tax=Yoonia sp. TaxID=2212373 RepID=UPI0035C7B9F2